MELVSGKVVPGCSNAGNPFHECTIICIEKLNSGDVHKKEKKLFGFGKRTPSRETSPGSPARGSRSPLAGYFGKKKVESGISTPTTDHTNGNFLSRLSPLQQLKNEPANSVDSLPASPSLALYAGGDYFARRTNQYGGEDDDDLSPKPFGTHPKTPEHPLRTPKSRPRTPERYDQEDPISIGNRPRTPKRPSYTLDTRPRTPIHESTAIGRRPQTPEHRPKTPERPSYTSDTRPRTPIQESAATERRPQTPETRSRTPEHGSTTSNTRPRMPIHESAATGRRPQTPETRPRTPEHRSTTSDTRPRTPIHESAANGRRPQTPETRLRTTNRRGRSPEFTARDPGPRSKTPEPQPTFLKPFSMTPKLRSKTPEPSPRIPQVLPISHRSLDSAGLQMPQTVETRPRMPEIHDESRPKTSVYRGRSPDHREMISQTQQAHAYNNLGSKAESVYIEKDDESVLLFPETLLSPQERPPSRPITPNRRGHETPSKHEEHFDQLDDSASTDDDKFSFVDEHDDNAIWFYPETTSKSGSSTPLRSEQEEQYKANNEPPELSDESQSFSLTEITRMRGIISKNETRNEIQSIVSESHVSVGNYKVKASVSATLEYILHKHGDIASASKLQSLATRSYYLEMLASVVLELQTTPLEHLKESRVVEMVAIVKDVESVKIKADWLKPVLEDIVDAVKHYDEHKLTMMEKEMWERDVLLTKREMEKQVKELREKEKKLKEQRVRLTEMAGNLGDIEMRRERLNKSFAFLSSKVDKVQGKTLLQGIL